MTAPFETARLTASLGSMPAAHTRSAVAEYFEQVRAGFARHARRAGFHPTRSDAAAWSAEFEDRSTGSRVRWALRLEEGRWDVAIDLALPARSGGGGAAGIAELRRTIPAWFRGL